MRPFPNPVTMRLAAALAAAMVVLIGLEQWTEAQRWLEPVNLVLARATEIALQQLEIPVSRRGAVLSHPDGFSYRITYVCSGVRPVVLIAVTLLMVPATWRSRLAGLCIALAGVEALNLCRLVHLYWTGVVDPGAFFLAHRVIWNAVAILAMAAFLALWLHLSRRRSPGVPLAS